MNNCSVKQQMKFNILKESTKEKNSPCCVHTAAGMELGISSQVKYH